MEVFLNFILLLGLSFAPRSYGQGLVTGTTEGSTRLEPWLVGLAAVTGFLGVAFVVMLINRLFFKSKKAGSDGNEETKTDIQLSQARNTYDNLAVEVEEEPSDLPRNKTEDKKATGEQKLTSL